MCLCHHLCHHYKRQQNIIKPLHISNIGLLSFSETLIADMTHIICACMSSHVLHQSLICSFSNCNLVTQFGNTCYCNSVLQALYFCRPFREKVLAYKIQPRRKESLLTCLADLFNSIATQKKKVGVIPPKKFVSRLRKENGEKILGPTASTLTD